MKQRIKIQYLEMNENKQSNLTSFVDSKCSRKTQSNFNWPFNRIQTRENISYYENFRWRRWGSSLPGLRTPDPPLSHQLTPAEFFFRCTCLGGGTQKNVSPFGNPTITPSTMPRKKDRERERKEKNALNSGHSVS
jgi:hypothetical protein